MIDAITSFFSSKVTLVMVGIILALGGYSYYASSKNTSLTLQVAQKDRDIGNLIEGYNATLEIERARNTFEITTQKEKESLIKVTEKVKQEVQMLKKYKEVKQDGKECPKLGTFSL